MAEKRSRRRKSPEQDAVEHIIEEKDKTFIEERFINHYKGRGVFAREYIEPKSFVVEYRGVLSLSKGADDKSNKYAFDFIWNGKQYCINASKEDQTLGRLVNDDHVHPNCKVKRIMVRGRPHLCLFAIKDIFPGEEITYNYGDSSWPWRSLAPCEEQSDLKVHEREPPSEKEALGKSEAERTGVSLGLVSSHDEPEALGGSEAKRRGVSPGLVESNDDTESVAGIEAEMTGVSPGVGSFKDNTCHHRMFGAVLGALENCEDCTGPVSSLKWLGVTCKLCSRSWHKSCFLKKNSSLDATKSWDHVSDSEISDSGSDDVYLPSRSSDGSSSDFPTDTEHNEDAQSVILPYLGQVKPLPSEGKTKRVPLLEQKASKSDCINDQPCSDNGVTHRDNWIISTNTAEQPPTPAEPLPSISTQQISSCTLKNYCYVCKKAQSKISRHFKKHEKEDLDIARALSLPKNSKERKMLLDKLRNKGNYEHNQEVINSHSGSLKVRRRAGSSKVSENSKRYVHCTYCKGMFLRKELWRHTKRCPLKKKTEDHQRSKVLSLADMAESTSCHTISTGVWKVLGKMRQDDIGSVVRNDFIILQLAQSLYNKHGNDPTKFEYIRTKVREMGRLLLTLRVMYSIQSFEDGVKPNNFYKIVNAVKRVSGYDEEKNSYSTPSLALKLGHSLKKIGDIILCRAIAAEDEHLTKATERFIRLCSKEWAGYVSHTALATLRKSRFNQPSIIPFTEDVQKLHKYLEENSAIAIHNLKKHESPQAYGELARLTLSQIILFNRRRAGEVSKMSLESFKKRDQTELHGDVAASLSLFEQKLARHFSRVEIMGKRGRKVAVLLNPEVVCATTLLVEKRQMCNVHKDNPFLFGRPECPFTSHYRGQDCVRTFARLCGAKNPQYLRSTQLRKHIATQSQILNLKNNELDQLANFLGHDIRVHRDFYRLPEATIEVAKITKILLAMEKGTLAQFKGKSLDEIEIEDKLDPEMYGELDDGDDKVDEDDESSSDDEHNEGERGRDEENGGDEDGGTGRDEENGGDEDGGTGRDEENGGAEDGGTGRDEENGGDEDGGRGCPLGLMENERMEIDEEQNSSSGKRKTTILTEDLVKTSKGQKKKCVVSSSREIKRRKYVKRPWSNAEISAVMKFFKTHIEKGKLASKIECEQCKLAEDPILKNRTLQNIRDFVRNRGLKLKK
ncbi:uncharacterized protein LOC130915906 isoform X1 [Corythoichthys intestinalis]|uniref:uncharacterized protein LOC130915906 isoform X1 n=2 Tax=Corythoichthys intestinalis TaxID=161448 RepID=UPI0025A61769|nr:uncharacterized protein LOC130915906 isoform X1 [Corythoichthys intestinalis]XP_057692101.1 uncharacterized protein LOC130915906 isoform X1 [Corythoichthys intestinalis]XP_057692103.1 uncharacterized protein LOC130915906 isoform X1 [Corythoichthys intestinalis]